MPRKKRPEPKPKFKVGDRVKDRNRLSYSFSSPNAAECQKLYSEIRTGVIEDVVMKTIANGSRQVYYEVIWDNKKTPSQHSQMRLVLVED